MAYCDFVVKYDPKTEAPEDLTKKILYTLFYKRIANKKPTICFIGGDSGEGKSWGCLTLQETLLSFWGLKLKDYLNSINVYTPLQYPTKFRKLINDKKLKKVHIIAMHEARDIVRAKKWYSFLNQAIGDINAQSRSVKRMVIFIISQFIRDISTDIRYTLNYYCKVSRPLGKKPRLYINIMWKDDRDLEKPKLRKRKLSGYIITPDGRYRRIVPQYLVLNKPSKEVITEFEKRDRESKSKIIEKKMDKLIKEMSQDLEDSNNKINAMVEHYSKNTHNLTLIGKRRGKKWYLNKEFKKLHDLTDGETKEFQEKLIKKLKEEGVLDNESK